MTVTALADHARTTRGGGTRVTQPAAAGNGGPRGPRALRPVPVTAPISVTIEVTIALEPGDGRLEEVTEVLRAAVRRIAGAEVRVGSRPGGAAPRVGAGGDTATDETPADGLAGAAGSTAAAGGPAAGIAALEGPAAGIAALEGPAAGIAALEGAAADAAAGVRILPEERRVWRGSEEISLSRLEFDLLLHLADHPRQVFSRRQLLDAVWGYHPAGGRTVDVHVRRLRAKLGAGVSLLTTVRGVGYRLDGDARISVIRRRRPPDTGTEGH